MSFLPANTTAHLHIDLVAHETPQVRRHCARCNLSRPFTSSGKFRVNAQRKLIDVWLIYRCASCDFTWNQAIHERTPVRAIDAAALQAFMRNDPGLAAHHAGDTVRLRAAGAEILTPETQDLTRKVLRAAHAETQAILVTIGNAAGCALRLDRVLAWGLSLTRSDVAKLGVEPHMTRALKRAALDGQEIVIDLTACSAEVRSKCLHGLAAVEHGVR